MILRHPETNIQNILFEPINLALIVVHTLSQAPILKEGDEYAAKGSCKDTSQWDNDSLHSSIIPEGASSSWTSCGAFNSYSLWANNGSIEYDGIGPCRWRVLCVQMGYAAGLGIGEKDGNWRTEGRICEQPGRESYPLGSSFVQSGEIASACVLIVNGRTVKRFYGAAPFARSAVGDGEQRPGVRACARMLLYALRQEREGFVGEVVQRFACVVLAQENGRTVERLVCAAGGSGFCCIGVYFIMME